jgi:hypothetical protein
VNYLLEPVALLGAVWPILFMRTRELALRPKSNRLKLASHAGLAIVLLTLPGAYLTTPRALGIILKELPKTTVQERIAGMQGRVLLMEHAFTHPDPAAHALADPVYYCIMVDRGRLSPEPFLEKLNSRFFDAITVFPVARVWFFEAMRDHRVREAWMRNYQNSSPPGRVPQLWTPKSR